MYIYIYILTLVCVSVFLIRYEYIIRVNGSSTDELNLGFVVFADSHQGKQRVQVMLSPGHVVFLRILNRMNPPIPNYPFFIAGFTAMFFCPIADSMKSGYNFKPRCPP